MNMTSRCTLGLLAAGLTLGPTTVRAQQDFTWSGRVASGQSVEVKGVNGNVRAVRAAGNQVGVEARLQEGRKGRMEDIEFEVVEHDDGVTICAIYPAPRNRAPNECRQGSRGGMNVRDNDTQVHFIVRVPAGVKFVGRTVNGGVDVESLESDVEANTVNGAIEIRTSGYAQANTVNGSIFAAIGEGNWAGSLEFETVNGSITVELPRDVGADITAATVNGNIHTDFPLTVRGRFSSRRLSGTIGGGGRRLRLETVNGTINIREGR